MLGKLIQEKAIIDEKSILLGEDYLSGIYNIVIDDGIETKTVRVIKE